MTSKSCKTSFKGNCSKTERRKESECGADQRRSQSRARTWGLKADAESSFPFFGFLGFLRECVALGGTPIEGGCASASFKRAKATTASDGEDAMDVWLLDIG